MSRVRLASVGDPEVLALAALLGVTPAAVIRAAYGQRNRAIVRLVLVLAAWLVRAVIVVGAVYGFILLAWALFGPVPSAPDMQLPTL